MHKTMLIVIAVLNIPLYCLLGKSFFGGWQGLFDAIVAMITPGTVSAFTGKAGEHRIGRFTFIMFVCIVTVACEYHVVAKFVFRIAKPWVDCPHLYAQGRLSKIPSPLK